MIFCLVRSDIVQNPYKCIYIDRFYCDLLLLSDVRSEL